MTTQAWIRLGVLGGAWLLFGCASVPPAAQSAAAGPRTAPKPEKDDPYSGRLFRYNVREESESAEAIAAAALARSAPAAPAAAPQATTAAYPPASAAGVVPASATVPASESWSGQRAQPRVAAGQVYPPPAPMDVPEKAKPKPKPNHSYSKSDEDSPVDNFGKGVKKAFGYGPNEPVARQAFQEGETLFREKKYDEAAKKFKTAASRWPDSLLEEDALFLLGESYFFADRYSKAHDTYGQLLKKFDNSRYLDTAVKRQFAIARYWEQAHEHEPHWPITPNFTDKTRPWFDTWNNAMNAYQRVWLNDPTGPLADDSWFASANAHFAAGRYEEAARRYDEIRKQFPSSPFQEKAHILGVQSKLRMYQGQDYDGTPLDEAKEINRQTLAQFGSQLGDEKARVVQTSKQIVENQALREWSMGQYYEKKRYYGAARYYYQNLIKQYPLTQAAELAKKRLPEICDKPDQPTNHVRWLTRLLGDEE